jgi:F-box and WD-40 domain protein 1/11
MSLMNGLPTSAVSKIVEAQRPRLYINFFDRLPPEVCLKVLSYLDPLSLIRTAQASRDWMSLSLDWKLWQHLYYLEGWRIIPSELEKFERELSKHQALPARTRPSFDMSDEQAYKKRATPGLVTVSLSLEDAEMQDVDALPSPEQESLFGKSRSQLASGSSTASQQLIVDQSRTHEAAKQAGVENHALLRQSLQFDQANTDRRNSARSSWSGVGFSLSFLSSLTVRDRRTDSQKINWQYLYTQRRRLEANWEHGKYVNFQLPHPDYLEEMHEECIYTIQHSGRYLVSGSRDKTLRIWDLDTRRLVREPLEGHQGSVLCLQFDADPSEDLIVSGSSDATVILWKFSTGQLLQTLKNAHRESVLNVRFDHRILVTCSKDKTIKIFNRKPLYPGDLGYPVVRSIPTILNNYGFNPSPLADLPVKQPYTMIGCLDGHGAAVNAVQIYGNEIVSASGDRHVKVWEWPLQTCTRTLVGHQKGIACVQYDGRRIVSGSSDNEVKVFDKETGLEVASLRGHTDLVRTVQAGFGDLPYSAEEDQADARQVDSEYFKAVDSGAVPRTVARRRDRNAGSRKPEDIMAYGAKLPPGGGGGKYGRIVSGSYDETIIIWRRDKEGVWKAQHTMRQEDAAQAAAREFNNPAPVSGGSADVPGSVPQGPPAPGSQAFFHNLINQIVPHGPHALRQALHQHPSLVQYPYLQAVIGSQESPAIRNTLRSVVAAALARQQIILAQQLQAAGQGLTAVPATYPAPGPPPGGPPPTGQGSAGHSATLPPNLHQPQAQAQADDTSIPVPGVHIPLGATLPQAHAQGLHPHLVPASMARVFKLQFDARRIICCSQTAVIVGWDFANNDEKIIEASRFFAPIE